MILRLIFKNLQRRKGRSVLTIGGVASALLLMVLVDSLSHGLSRALESSTAARTLIVYRQNRYCPQTSFLPERYAEKIRELPGVDHVLPVKVFLNNCRASLDLVAFHGVPADQLADGRALHVVEGDFGKFTSERDAALLGQAFAQRRGLSVGDKFRFNQITVSVAGIFASQDPIDEALIVTHLEFLQRSGPVDRLSTVTQFEVRVHDASAAPELARTIDAMFATAEEPTDTRSRQVFLEAATRDLQEILRFAGVLGLACVAVVLSLVANSILMAVQERRSEFAVFRTLGYQAHHVVAMVLGEAAFLAVAGGVLGVGIAYVILALTQLTIGVEGVSVAFTMSWSVAGRGLLLAIACGAGAGLIPAWLAGRRNIVASLRAA